MCYNLEMNLIDLTGRRFGKLVVTGLREYRVNSSGTREMFWQCRCDCMGCEIYVRSFTLRNGETTSCGCVRLESVKRPRKPDLVGLKFGRLTVLERVTVKQGNRVVYTFRCACSCGSKEKTIQGSHLRSGQTKSCGCARKEMLPTTKYLPGSHFVIKEYKRSAANRHIKWELADNDVMKIIESNCHYCGTEPSQTITPPDRIISVIYKCTGIDRMDSSKGYESGNVVPCCTECNYMKRTLGYERFIERCRRIAANHPAVKLVNESRDELCAILT